jgi:cob(I)alamin adenosyltransferase
MKIYTKTGDTGDTSLYGGKRVPKSSPRIEAYGTVDELNAELGSARSFHPTAETEKILDKLQNELFVLGADLAAPAGNEPKTGRISEANIGELEKIIDRLEEQLEPLDSFILPGGNQVCARIHVARTVCRRAERRVEAFSRTEDAGKFPLVYLNRLADLLFVLARYENKAAGISEKKWSGDR